MSEEERKDEGFRFVGPHHLLHQFMQAAGLVNDHHPDLFPGGTKHRRSLKPNEPRYPTYPIVFEPSRVSRRMSA